MSSSLVTTCSMSSSYGIMFWGYRKGSRANSNYEFIGIKHIKCYFLQKIRLRCNSVSGAGDRDTGENGTSRGSVFGMARRERGGLATNYVSCYSYAVRAVRVELMLLSETCCLSVSSCKWCCRYPKASAMPWGVSGGNNIWRVEFFRGLGMTGEGNLLGSCPLG